MTFRRGLVHLCDIQQFTEARSSTGDVTRTWSDGTEGNPHRQADVRCRFVYKNERMPLEIFTEATLTTITMLVPADTSVKQVDRVANIRYNDGPETLVDAGPFKIIELLPRHGRYPSSHHIYLKLERVETDSSG